MSKISAIIKSQATNQFKEKRKEVIKKVLDQHSESSNFQEILNLYKV